MTGIPFLYSTAKSLVTVIRLLCCVLDFVSQKDNKAKEFDLTFDVTCLHIKHLFLINQFARGVL